MGTKKRDLEIVYNLVWKNRAQNSDDKSNIIGMYDIPSTTLNWEIFKSYLLKNSGCNSDDVKVSYIDSDEKEIPIDSQTDFHLALYSFRKRARVGEIITLMLARHKKMPTKNVSYDFGVQCDEYGSYVDSPPPWFMNFMRKFKKDIVDEITTSINTVNQKGSNNNQSSLHHTRKSKSDIYKRSRKHQLLIGDTNIEKEATKSIKLERKLENKLEKLENKTLKIKAKKLALRVSSDSDVGRGSSRSRPIGLSPRDEMLMDASSVSPHDATIPHMAGGEIYEQQWEVLNTGKVGWNDETELRYAWGSQLLKPIARSVSVPNLMPGEKGVVSVHLDIPETPGIYECYWHFHHIGRRFGHWLGCQVIVDEPVIKSQIYTNRNETQLNELKSTGPPTFKKMKIDEEQTDNYYNFEAQLNDPKMQNNCKIDVSIDDVVSQLEDLEVSDEKERRFCMHGFKTRSESNSSDTDNNSIVSLVESNNVISNDEFELVGMSADEIEIMENDIEKIMAIKQEKVDGLDQSPNDTNNNNELENASVGALPAQLVAENIADPDVQLTVLITKDLKVNASTKEDSDSKQDFAYIFYKGIKYPFHKKYLRPEYFINAEKVEDPKMQRTVLVPGTSSDIIEDCISVVSSAAECCDEEEPKTSLSSQDMSSSKGSRLFVFPLHSPGFEVVYPDAEEEKVVEEPKTDPSYSSSFDEFLASNVHGNKQPKPYREIYPDPWSAAADEAASYKCNGFPHADPHYPEEQHAACSYGFCTVPQLKYVLDSNQLPAVVHNNPGCSTSHCSLRNQPSCTPLQYAYTIPPRQDPYTFPPPPQAYTIPIPPQQPLYNIPTHLPYSMTPQEPPYVPTPLQQPRRDIGFSPGSIRLKPVSVLMDAHITESTLSHQSHSNQSTSSAELDPNGTCGGAQTNSTHPAAEDYERDREANAKSFKEQAKFNMSDAHKKRAGGTPGAAGRDNLFSGAAMFAASAMSTARNVINMVAPLGAENGGVWRNGHWMSDNTNPKREKALNELQEMGFINRDLNATLLARYNDDVHRVISELIQ